MTSRPASEEVRRRLVEAAVRQLADDGMRGLTHRKVESRAGLSQGTTKYHFGSLDGLVEAVLRHMVEVEGQSVLAVPPEVVEEVERTGALTPALLDQAAKAMGEVLARRELLLARYELILHVARTPALQPILKEARGEIVRRIAQSLPVPAPEAGARMVAALVDGITLHQLTAREPLVDRMAPLMLLATSAAALQLPTPGVPPAEEGQAIAPAPPGCDGGGMDPVLIAATDQMTALLEQAGGQRDGATPCEGWTVGELVDHVVGVSGAFLTIARGEEPDWSAAAGGHEDPVGTFRANSEAMAAEDQARVPVDMAVPEYAVHGFDLAVALGRPTGELNPQVAEVALAKMRALLQPELRGEHFAAEQPAPEGADAYVRLAAFSGRVV